MAACGSTVDNGCGQRFKCDECKVEWDNSNWTAGTCVDAAGNLTTPTNLVPQQLYGLPGGQGNPQGQGERRIQHLARILALAHHGFVQAHAPEERREGDDQENRSELSVFLGSEQPCKQDDLPEEEGLEDHR
jgi:hypothetical protein